MCNLLGITINVRVPKCPILHNGAKLSMVPNCLRCQIVHFTLRCQIVRFTLLVPNCPLFITVPNCPRCQIVHFTLRCQIVRGAKLSALHSRCQIVRCQIVRGAKLSYNRYCIYRACQIQDLIPGPTFRKYITSHGRVHEN